MVYWQRYSTADTGSLRPDRFAPGVLSMCMRYCDREVADSLGLGRSRVLFPVSERFDALGEPIFECIHRNHAVSREVGLARKSLDQGFGKCAVVPTILFVGKFPPGGGGK